MVVAFSSHLLHLPFLPFFFFSSVDMRRSVLYINVMTDIIKINREALPGCAALTIAGSDSGGGAGIQADLKTFSAFRVFGTSVITAITAQNLSGVTAIQAVDTEVVHKQLLAVLEGFPIKAIKTGMLFSAEIIDVIATTLSEPQYCGIPLVVDPVFVATSGSKLINDDAVTLLKEKLFPLATLITPNMLEAEALGNMKLENRQDLEEGSQRLYDMFGCAVLLKGGHLTGRAVDVLYDADGKNIYESELVTGVNNHGSGCTLGSAIAASIARGEGVREAVGNAKNYILRSLKKSWQLSEELRVINHFPG